MNKIVTAVFAILMSQSIGFAEAREGTLSVAGDTAYISGYIGTDLGALFSAMPGTVKTVNIRSEGGLVNVAVNISNIIHKNHMTTVVNDYCYSACAIIFASGERRIAHRQSTFLIHGAHVRGGSASPNIAMALFQLNASVINRYIEYGVDESFIRRHVTYPQVMFEPAFDARTAMAINLATTLQ